MSQIFSADSQMLSSGNVTLVTTAETTGLSSNALHGPFGTCKVKVSGVALISTGTGVTGVQVRVRRNQSAENIVLNPGTQTIAAAASTIIAVPFAFNDSVPDGRDLVYSLTVQQVAATGNGSILTGTEIDSTVISG